MRLLKAIFRILLLLSIFNYTFAGLAQTPTSTMEDMRVDLVTVAEDMTDVSLPERGHTQSKQLSEWSGTRRPASTARDLHPRLDIPTQSFNEMAGSLTAEDPESQKFFNKELNRKMKEYLLLGSIAGIFAGVANGIQKEIIGTISPGAETVGRSVRPLVEYPPNHEDLVSLSLSNMRDEDLQMLSIISRRMLNGLD